MVYKGFWQIQFVIQGMNFVFEQFVQWFDQIYFYVCWQIVDIVVGFDGDRWVVIKVDIFDDVWIQCVLGEEICFIGFFCFGVKNIDEQFVNCFVFDFWVVYVGQGVEEECFFVGMDQWDVVVFFEQGDDLVGFVLVYQVCVYEYIGQLIIDGFVQQYGYD